MTMYIYHSDGHAVGFLHATFVHDLDGRPLGRVMGSRVHRLDGSYVGEFFKDTVVDKPVASRRSIRAVPSPARLSAVDVISPRRAVVNYGFRDVFDLLRQPGANDDEQQVWDVAAE